jgi:DNA-binding NtrC family response regulator
VRELENAIKHAITFAKESHITVADIPPRIISKAKSESNGKPQVAFNGKCKSLKWFLRNQEKRYLEQVLELYDGNKEEAAKTLKISLATLYRKLPEQLD